MNKNSTKKLTTMGILIAISIILIVSPLRFPFPAAPFLEYDAGDIPILIGSFIFGPLSGILLTAVTSVIQAMTVSSASGWVGCFMHIFATSALVGIASGIYFKKKTLKWAVTGLVLGSLSMTAIMIVLNLIIDPIFYDMPIETVKQLIVPAILPFNIMKAGINSFITLIIYKSAGGLLERTIKK
ncbi:ECF transporter S component (folate family) [Ruminiclostridium sufflavum DSM 19573]|uniref:Riboflavin transporter n=1 Tax=Ruminiclostridium sufflavum DSM 19573 TaxID=1121337 RepID=A0A318XIY3_9FIRM|nr:ECF transporter S component [Ruminiclostridium sufflavum]PYG87145.1 ECF transporter S component (folate family) [Ruminiclostridium sufflavum DSM 19573]